MEGSTLIVPRLLAPLLLTVRRRLMLLAATLIVPATLLGALLALKAYQQEREGVERQLSETAHALSLVVDRQLGQSEVLLTTLATSPSLTRGDLAAFERQARAAVAGADGWVTLVAADGRQIFNTSLASGAPLPPVVAPDVFQLLEGGHTHITNLSHSQMRADPVVAVVVPVHQQGRFRYALAEVMLPSSLSSVLADQGLPKEWVAAIVDRDNVVVARNRNAERYIGSSATGSLRAALEGGSASGVVESVTLDGMRSLTAYSRSPNSGWTVVIGAPRSLILQQASGLLALVAIMAATLVMVGLAMSMWVGRGLVRSVESLVDGASAVGRGEIPAAPATGMVETDQVALALRTAAQRLGAREEELRRLNETLEARVTEATGQLLAASKLEAIGRLTGGVAHDFNNLLTTVRVNLDLLTRRLDDQALLRFVEGARQGTDRGARLVGQLLAFARKQRLEPAPVDVNAAVTTAAELLRSTLGRVRVELELAAGLPPALADPTQLELIIMNLAINARDAMDGAGRLGIGTGRVRLERPPRRPEEPCPGEYVVMCVTDTGSGMSPEVRERVFEPFFTTKSVGRGSGLGLPQVLGVVQQLGGGLRLDSAPGQGTRIHVYLPLAASAAVSEPLTAVQAPVAELAGLRVLVVDDDVDVGAATAMLLREGGCEVSGFSGGAAALDAVAAGLEADVALLDYAMPHMDGVELARRLQRLLPGLPVVLMSGFADAARLEPGWPGELLQKPFTREELSRRLAQACGRPSHVGA